MNWVKKCKLPAIEAIQYNGQLCLKLKDLWQALHSLFNLVQNCQINLDLLEEIPNKLGCLSLKKSSITKCNNSLTSRPDKLSWRHFKVIVNDSTYLKNFINIANTYML